MVVNYYLFMLCAATTAILIGTIACAVFRYQMKRFIQRLVAQEKSRVNKIQQELKEINTKNADIMGNLDSYLGGCTMTEKIKIKYHTDKIDRLNYIDGKSDWIDLRAAEDVTLKFGEFKLISLGVSMQLPEGYEAHIVPRSSTYKNFGVIQTNHCAVIDNSYCGDNDIWKYPVLALRDTEIHVNDRICQFRIVKNQPKIQFEEVKQLGEANRGGFGSTGRQ